MKEDKKTAKREVRAHIPADQPRTHGGPRPGSGRPRTGSKAMQFKAPKEMAEFIEQQPNRSAFIKECVERVMRTRNPERVTEHSTGCEPCVEMGQSNNPSPVRAIKCGYETMPPLQGSDPIEPVKNDRVNTLSSNISPFQGCGGAGSALLPFVDVAVAAGSPIGTDAAEYGELTNLLSFFPDAKVALKVEGRSMEDADIHSGDLLLVDNEVNVVEEHHIALCELNGAYTVKHVRRESDGTFVLLPRNEAYQPIRVTPADRFFVRGRVVGVMKHL